MRLQKLAEENDLKLAQEMMGLGSSGGGGGFIDNMNPSTKDEFEELSEQSGCKNSCENVRKYLAIPEV